MLTNDTPLDRFTRGQAIRMTGITPQQFGRWERLGLIDCGNGSAPEAMGAKAYTFADLVSLRTIKHLTQEGVPARRLCRAISALRGMFQGIQEPLREIRFGWDGCELTAEYGGNAIEPFSGQLVLRFEHAGENLRAMPERSAEQWLEIALAAEHHADLRPLAIEAYLHLIDAAPDWAQPLINLGTLYYELADLEAASDCYRKAIAIAPDNPLAHFNLGSVLDELKIFPEAARHLAKAVLLKPEYADAHYNLARVYDEMGCHVKARSHWQRYLELDPSSSWSDYARERLAAIGNPG